MIERNAKILALRALGKTYDDIGAEVGITKARVYQILKEATEGKLTASAVTLNIARNTLETLIRCHIVDVFKRLDKLIKIIDE